LHKLRIVLEIGPRLFPRRIFVQCDVGPGTWNELVIFDRRR
jgi:hypothetical protein